MGRGSGLGLLGTVLKASLTWTGYMAMGGISMLMETTMKGSLETMCSKGPDVLCGLMAMSISENGSTIKCTVWGSSLGRMDAITRGRILKASKRAMGCSKCRMVGGMKGSGLLGNSMAWGYKSPRMGSIEKASGPMGNESDESMSPRDLNKAVYSLHLLTSKDLEPKDKISSRKRNMSLN
eukprot:CAMPEP_0201283270 /NCGR_PEP_ID=MMETSP1317-20130820/8122_1 /ASSEMBLY_ACC=CAM_ASM_000770 /TAXON_ID=187299 /ORGANISM="Undescribed Undescribed, Strain Undescribed" /LENGTH=179 /DNA_ID=CAMNT_0047598963 /DNA_START=147 /DNA_END=686 /DNA_ORIENTATION=+